MLIRSFQKERNIKKILINIVVIIIGVILVSKGIHYVQTKFSGKDLQQETQGSITSRAGIIKDEKNFPLYTHYIESNGEKAYLRSSTLNLNSYTDQENLEIEGTIKEYFKGLPIIDVDTIKIPEQKILIKNNIYTLINDLLVFDFSTQPQLSVHKTSKEIEVLYNNEKMFSIERFLCNKVLKNKSCTYLIEDYDQTQKENFDSYWGYTFYKHGSGLRTLFDGNMFGYIFKNIDQSTMMDISSMLRIIDKTFIINNKSEQIKSTCTSKEKGKLKSINFSKIIPSTKENTVTIYVEGESEKKEALTCSVTFDIRNRWNIIKTSFNKQAK